MGAGPSDRRPARRWPAAVAAVATAAFTLALLATPVASRADDESFEVRVKAAYIFNFLTFVEREPEGGEAVAPPPRICVLGDDPVLVPLRALSGRKVHGEPVEVVAAAAVGEAAACRILVIGKAESARLPTTLRALAGTRVLTVSDIPRFSRSGGVIGFVTEGGRVRIEVSQEAARNAGLRVSAKLLEIARVVP